MKTANRKIPEWFLSHKEEKALSKENKEDYYQRLREYCNERKLCTTTPGALTIAPKLKSITGKIAKMLSNILAGGQIEVTSDGLDNIPEGGVIFASTHQGIMDNMVWMPENPRHCILLHHKINNRFLLLAQYNTGLILVSKMPEDAISRMNNKL